MPIKPENRHLYPRDWPQIRAAILERDHHACKWCEVPNHAYGVRWDDGRFDQLDATNADAAFCEACTKFPEDFAADCGGSDNPPRGRIIQIILTIAHLNHDPTDNRGDNLAALCQRCHNRHDHPHRAENAAVTRDNKRGQLRLEFDGRTS